MKYIAISTYSPRLNRKDIVIDDVWTLPIMLSTLSSFFNPTKNATSVTITSRFLPLSRFLFVQKINHKILHKVLENIVRKSQTYILWINDPDLFTFHNEGHFTHLILSCDPLILASGGHYIRYRECFKKGWIFTYTFKGNPVSKVFKNKSRSEVISGISKAN